MDPQRLTRLAPLTLALLLACPSKPEDAPAAERNDPAKPAEPTKPGSEAQPAQPTPTPTPDQGASDLLQSMLTWLPAEALAVSVDRLDPAQRFDPATLAVVFALPPKAADLLEDRRTLDEALAMVFDGDAKAESWLGPQSLAFTVPLAKKPYFVRPLLRPVAEVEPLLEQSGFTRNEIEGFGVWLPSGAFPWRIALLEKAESAPSGTQTMIAFIPVEIAGAGLEPLVSASKQADSAIETQIVDALGKDPFIQLTLLSGGPLLHLDVDDPINQVQFALRRANPKGDTWEGQIVLMPGGDPVACSQQLRERSHPEENQQVQALLKKVDFLAEGPLVIGRLVITAEDLKHFRPR